jgi:hypothetical protein
VGIHTRIYAVGDQAMSSAPNSVFEVEIAIESFKGS